MIVGKFQYVHTKNTNQYLGFTLSFKPSPYLSAYYKTGWLFPGASFLGPGFCLDMTIIGLQQRRRRNNSVVNIVILNHTNNVFLQYQISLLSPGCLDSRVSDAECITGIPAPRCNSPRCSIVTFMQEVGVLAAAAAGAGSTKPLNCIFNSCASDARPYISGGSLRKVDKSWIGWLLKWSMPGRLALARSFPSRARKSTLTFKIKGIIKAYNCY